MALCDSLPPDADDDDTDTDRDPDNPSWRSAAFIISDSEAVLFPELRHLSTRRDQ